MKLEHLAHGWGLEPEEKFLKTPVGIFLLGEFLGTLSPSPTDPIHFWLQAHVLTNPSVSPTLRALLSIVDWYFLDSLWFLLLLVIAYFLHVQKVTSIRRVIFIGGLLGAGIAVGIIARFI